MAYSSVQGAAVVKTRHMRCVLHSAADVARQALKGELTHTVHHTQNIPVPFHDFVHISCVSCQSPMLARTRHCALGHVPAHALSAAALLLLSCHVLLLAIPYLPDSPHKQRGYKATAVTNFSSLRLVHDQTGFCRCGPCIVYHVLYDICGSWKS
jgi:hypothetical protein